MKQGTEPAAILVRLALRKALAGCESVLDIGCGVDRTLRLLGVPNTTGLEGYPPSLEKARELKTHDHFVQGDVRRLTEHFKPGQVDACVAMDLIEHLPKEEGFKLMEALDEHDDVQHVYANFDIEESELAEAVS